MAEYVWRAGVRNGGDRPIHTSADCPRLGENRELNRWRRDAVPDDVPVCQWCQGNAPGASKCDWSYQDALREAADKS